MSNKKERITIREVAEKANLSPATVSLILNAKKKFPPETVERVLSAARELGYVPNILAREFRRASSEVIALVISDITNPFYPSIARSAEKEALEHNLTTILCNTENSPSQEYEYIRILSQRKVLGLVMTSIKKQADLLSYVRMIPNIVLVNRWHQDQEIAGCDFVGTDNKKIGQMAAEHFLNRQKYRVAVIHGPSDSGLSEERLEGFLSTLKAYGVNVRPDWLIEGDLTIESGRMAMRILLETKVMPEAVFACNDMMAIGAMEIIESYGLRPGQDILIIGVDDIWVSKYLGLTTIRQPKEEMGKFAVGLLLDRIKTGRKESKKLLLPSHLVIRSTA